MKKLVVASLACVTLIFSFGTASLAEPTKPICGEPCKYPLNP